MQHSKNTTQPNAFHLPHRRPQTSVKKRQRAQVAVAFQAMEARPQVQYCVPCQYSSSNSCKPSLQPAPRSHNQSQSFYWFVLCFAGNVVCLPHLRCELRPDVHHMCTTTTRGACTSKETSPVNHKNSLYFSIHWPCNHCGVRRPPVLADLSRLQFRASCNDPVCGVTRNCPNAYRFPFENQQSSCTFCFPDFSI